MKISIEWDSTDEGAPLIIGSIMCDIPNKGRLPVTVKTEHITENKLVTIITNDPEE